MVLLKGNGAKGRRRLVTFWGNVKQKHYSFPKG